MRGLIYSSMPNEEYHSREGISSTAVKTVFKSSLAHWKGSVRKHKAAFDLGSAVHAMVLEPERDLVVRGPSDRRGAKWKDKQAELTVDQVLLPEGEFDIARNMADNIMSHPDAAPLFNKHMLSEQSIFVPCPKTGLMLKCRPDTLSPSTAGFNIVDIKTTVDASPEGFAKQVWNFGYAIQDAYYRRVCRLAGLDVNDFMFVAVEKEPPYVVAVHVLASEYIDWADKVVMDVLYRIKEAEERGAFQTGWPATNVIEAPRWLGLEPADNNLSDFTVQEA